MKSKDQRWGVAAGNYWGRLPTIVTHLFIIFSIIIFHWRFFILCALYLITTIQYFQSFCVSHSSFLFPLCHFLWLSSPLAFLSILWFSHFAWFFLLIETRCSSRKHTKQPGSGWFLENTVIPHVKYDRLQMRLIERSLYSIFCLMKLSEM